MKTTHSPFAVLWTIVSLFCWVHPALAGGTLNFLDLTSSSTVASGDDTYSSYVSTNGAFKFGYGSVDSVYVSTNGYFSMGEYPRYSLLHVFPGSSYYSVVAPFAADIDTSSTGSVIYTQFTSDDYVQMSKVSWFIQSETDMSFHGTKMMVAEWSSVPLYDGSSYTTNTFQGILITDDCSSYAVFIYECGGMEWGGGVIGWQAGTSQYASHYLSGENNSNDMGCLYSNTYSAVVFKINDARFRCNSGECVDSSSQCDGSNDCLDKSDEEGCAKTITSPPTTTSPTTTCSSDQFTCDNGKCIPEEDGCDFYNDCGDFSDELSCANVKLAIGLTVALSSVLIFGPPICVGIIFYLKNKIKRRRRRLIAAMTSDQTISMINPDLSQYQPVYKEAQFSSQDTPPSHDAFPSHPTQQTPSNQPSQPHNYPIQNQAYPGYSPAGPSPNQAYPPPTVQTTPQPQPGTGSANV